MYSGNDTPAGGFPHSDIPGSKLICQLPEAYRRLSRPSSPIIAKASTTCSYSLDPITLMSRDTSSQSQENARHARRIQSRSFDPVEYSLTQSKCCRRHGAPRRSFPSATLIRLYEFLKNSRASCDALSTHGQHRSTRPCQTLRC
jgi:hypothetical protein